MADLIKNTDLGLELIEGDKDEGEQDYVAVRLVRGKDESSLFIIKIKF